MREFKVVLFLLSSLLSIDAFMTPSSPRRKTATISSFDRIKSPSASSSYVNSDVSAFLFRDLLKKVRGKDENNGDASDNTELVGANMDGNVAAEEKGDDDEKESKLDIDAEKEVEVKIELKKEEIVVETTDEEEAEMKEETKKEDDKEGLLPFFAQVIMGSTDKLKATEEIITTEKAKEEEALKVEKETPPTPPPPAPKLSPREKALAEAQALRAQAEKARLEAGKMDAKLTLDKIVKLEKELNSAQKKNNNEEEARIQKEIESLQMKLRGEEAAKNKEETAAATADREKNASPSVETATEKKETKKKTEPAFPALSYEEIQNRADRFKKSPKFMRQLIAKTADFDFTDVDSINTTALIVKLYEDEQKALLFDEEVGIIKPDGGRSKKEDKIALDEKGKPKFTAKQIEDKQKEVERLPQFIKNLYGDDKNNDTAIAIALLEENWKEQQNSGGGWFAPPPSKKEESSSGSGSSGLGGGLFSELKRRREDMSELDAMVETLYPKTTRKENEGPTEAQVTKLLENVLTKKNVPFMPSGKPEAVPGGFLIRGTATMNMEDGKNGDDLIQSIDETMERNAPALKESLSVFYIADPYPEEEELGPGDWPPVLFITGPDVWRGPQQIIGTIISSAGLATLWYTAIYPFLLNPTFMKRADEALALGDAGMNPDLGWLNDLASPLFLCLLGIQLSHEVAHRAVAAAYEMEVTLPTFVPSLVSGIASSITALKTPPKNKQALFDFAIAGPLTGMVLSLIALYFGCVLTASTDASAYANLPSLPIAFLRESALGGGIIDGVLGNGVLDILPPTPTTTTANVPAGMEGVFDNNLPLHPLAIAGYISLQLNALSLLPFGRTDGGRISLALFGRNGAPPVGLLTAFGLFIRGAFGSDLILFYTTFLLFFQGEPEIPLRNEVDEIDFSRVLLATLSGVLVLLTLFPM